MRRVAIFRDGNKIDAMIGPDLIKALGGFGDTIPEALRARRRLQARLYVHDNEQPTLIVKGVKSGANGHGGLAPWLEPGTVAHFRNLTVEQSTR